MSWGTLFLVVAALIFFCLAIDLFAIKSKGIDFHFLGLMFFVLGVLLSPWPLPVSIGRPRA